MRNPVHIPLSRDPSVPLARNAHLLRWVEKMRALTRPAAVHWVDGSQEEYDALCAQMVEAGTLTGAQPGALARLLSTHGRTRATSPGWSSARSCARCRRMPPARPTTGSTRTRCGGRSRSMFSGAMAGRTMYVLAVQHGHARLTDVADRRAAHRLPVRRRQHADHGAYRDAGAGRDRQGRKARRALHAQPWARRSRLERPMCPGRAIPRSTSSTSRRRARSGRTARATAATRCSGRSASRCGSRRPWHATKAGWRSTC